MKNLMWNTCINFSPLSPSNFSGYTIAYIISNLILFSGLISLIMEQACQAKNKITKWQQLSSKPVFCFSFCTNLLWPEDTDHFLCARISKNQILLQLPNVTEPVLPDTPVNFSSNLNKRLIESFRTYHLKFELRQRDCSKVRHRTICCKN